MSGTEDLEMLRGMRGSFASALKDFASSPSRLRILKSVPFSQVPDRAPVKTVYVLDSSFNPPSKAHLRIASSALQYDGGPQPHRLLLLLATQNADKAPKPASFEDRLVMMTQFAQEIMLDLGLPDRKDAPIIDIGVTREPYFHKKAMAIDESDFYAGEQQQVHLTGFDTMIRIFNTKYYPPEHTLAPLDPFLSKHRLRVTYRPDDDWGSHEEQDKYIQDIADGKREEEGAKREWAERIQLVEGKLEGEDVVSSTLARAAAKDNPHALSKYVTSMVKDWIISEKLYKE